MSLKPYGFEVSHRLDGKVAIVTGVSDRGIGGSIAERLADDGAAVAILWMERPDRLIHRWSGAIVPMSSAAAM